MAAIALLLVAALAGFAAIAVNRVATRSAIPPGAPVAPGGPAGNVPNQAPPATGAAADLAGKVDPAVADITTQLADGSGTAAGTGMVLTSNGEILTNNHVIAGSSSISVQINGAGQTYTAAVVGVDPTNDVAVLQLANASGLPTINVGDSSKVAVGDSIVVIGNALGRGGVPAATSGTVAALDQSITASDTGNTAIENLTGMIRINAIIQPGDSGGPLVNSDGQVIGMDTAGGGGVRRRSAASVGFAIPINSAVSIAKQIESGQGGSTIQGAHSGFLGVTVNNAPNGGGAHIARVEPGLPAEAAGLVAGDIITSIDGTTVDSVTALSAALKNRKPGDKVTVSWTDSSGATHTADITLGQGPPA